MITLERGPLALPAMAGVVADFDGAVHGTARRLFGLAYSILRDRTAAEDAVQETFIRAWKNWEQTGAHPDPGPWLTRICVNHCLNRRAWLRRRPASEELPADFIGPGTRVPDDLDLDRAFGRLSKQQRAVIALHYYVGYSLDECAGVIGCRPGTVRTHLSRALRNMRRELDHG